MRRAIVRNIRPETLDRYLPANYEIVLVSLNEKGSADCIIEGEDHAGWTLDGYVIPRLASGLYFCEEMPDVARTDD